MLPFVGDSIFAVVTVIQSLVITVLFNAAAFVVGAAAAEATLSTTIAVLSGGLFVDVYAFARFVAIFMLGFTALSVILVSVHAANVTHKAKMYWYCTKYFFFAKDQPSKRPGGPPALAIGSAAPPGLFVGPGKPVTIKVFFIRHGESVWNSIFNKFGLGWPMRAITAVVDETMAFLRRPLHSVIIDSPLSARGRKQAKELAAFVRSDAGQKALPFDQTTSVVVCSNLRRAMETAIIGLEPRLAPNRERVIVDSCLQEGSRNADAQALATDAGVIPNYPLEGVPKPTAAIMTHLFDAKCHQGNKTMAATDPLNSVHKRIDEFARRIFGQARHGGPLRYATAASASSTLLPLSLVVVGHSLYFRNFFRATLPSTSEHISKTRKMQNCAVVSFDITFDPVTGVVISKEDTIRALHKGF